MGFLGLLDLLVDVDVRSEPSLLDPERPRALFIFARNGMIVCSVSKGCGTTSAGPIGSVPFIKLPSQVGQPTRNLSRLVE